VQIKVVINSSDWLRRSLIYIACDLPIFRKLQRSDI
jgi:hypothetical protein